jgi:uncharacterized RDD family membrane protein YckC
MKSCVKCGQPLDDQARFCPRCGTPVAGYPRPAGFWIRVVASFIDLFVFLPLLAISVANLVFFRSTLILVVIVIPGLLYKPLMEAYYGATLGKMVLGLRVMDADGRNLTVSAAYVRAVPFLISTGLSLVGGVIQFSSPEFQSVKDLSQLIEASQGNPLSCVESLANLFVLVDCLVAGFSYRKRAIHDMMAGSFCVYARDALAS